MAVLFSFAFNGVIAFLPLYLTNETTLSSGMANGLFSVFFLVSIIQVISGKASDQVGTVPVMVITLGLASSGLIAIVILSDTSVPLFLDIAVIVLDLGGHGYRSVRGAYLMEVVPEHINAGCFGIVRTLQMGSGAIAPALVGYLSETVGFQSAFGLLICTLVVATGLVGFFWIAWR